MNAFHNYNIIINNLSFEWNLNKAISNFHKHRITFHEAASAFFDDEGILLDDPDHSLDENRFILLAISQKANLLVISHCYREQSNAIRIISARKATMKESKQYAKLNESW